MKKLYSALVVAGLCLSPVSFNAVHAAEQTEAVEATSNIAAPAQPVEIDRPGMMDRMMFKLGLSKEQKQKIRSIRHAKREKAEALQNEQNTKLAALQNALKSGTDDEVRQAFADLQTTQQSLSAIHLEGLLETRTLLTPEQRNTFAGMSLHHLGGHKKGGHKKGRHK
jgi:Spy/CpxP family protein refolding chaperone